MVLKVGNAAQLIAQKPKGSTIEEALALGIIGPHHDTFVDQDHQYWMKDGNGTWVKQIPAPISIQNIPKTVGQKEVFVSLEMNVEKVKKSLEDLSKAAYKASDKMKNLNKVAAHAKAYNAGPKAFEYLLNQTVYPNYEAPLTLGMDYAKHESDLTAAIVYGMSSMSNAKTNPPMIMSSTAAAVSPMLTKMYQEMAEQESAAKFIQLTGADMALKIAGQPAEPKPLEAIKTVAGEEIKVFSGKMPKVGGEEEVVDAQLIAKHAVVVGQTEQDQLATELLDLERRLIEMEVSEMLKKKEDLRKQILALNADAETDKPLVITVEGQGVIEFSACSKEFKLEDKGKLASSLGEETFFEMAKFGVTDLKKVLSENELESMGKYVPTTTRTIKIKPKAK